MYKTSSNSSGNIVFKMEQSLSFCAKSIITLNIGGTIFQCRAETLKTFQDSLLAHLDEGTEHFNFEKGEYYFDRNPILFAYILDASRKGTIHLPRDQCGVTFREELDFWNISPRHVSPCCWEALYRSEEDVSTMKKLIKNLKENTNMCLMLKENVSLRQKIWLFLDEPNSSRLALIWGAFISFLILLSTLSTALSTLPQFTIENTEEEKEVLSRIVHIMGWANTTKEVPTMKQVPFLMNTDVVIHVILTFELILSFFACPCKKSFAKCFIRMAVILGYLSFWIAFAMKQNLSKLDTVHKIRAFIAMKHISVLQIGRLLYIAKSIPAFNIMGLTFSSSKHEMKIFVFMLGLLVCSFGFVMFMMEFMQNSNITNIFTAMYWALITLTTVGYGHYVPETVQGHVTAAVCAVCGVVCLALPIGVIASSFHTFYMYQKYAEKHVSHYGKEGTFCQKAITSET